MNSTRPNVVRRQFDGLREKEEAAGGSASGWDARKSKSEFLQRLSVTIARGNSRVLDCMRDDWQLQCLYTSGNTTT